MEVSQIVKEIGSFKIFNNQEAKQLVTGISFLEVVRGGFEKVDGIIDVTPCELVLSVQGKVHTLVISVSERGTLAIQDTNKDTA